MKQTGAVKLFKRYDLQDETDFSIETLLEMKDWLVTLWNDNPDDDMTEEEHDELINDIKNSDKGELYERLGGVGYCYDELDENGDVIEQRMTVYVIFDNQYVSLEDAEFIQSNFGNPTNLIKIADCNFQKPIFTINNGVQIEVLS